MMLGAWIVSLAGPVIARVLTSLGLGIATYAVSMTGYQTLRTLLDQYMSGIPSDALSVLAIAGVDQAMGILLGAVVARIAYLSATRVARLYGV